MSQTNIRERQPVEGHAGTPDPPARGSDPSPHPPEHDDLVWPPEPDSLNVIEVVPLERVSARETAPQAKPPQPQPDTQSQTDRAPDVLASTPEPGRELVPETHRFDDLQDLDLDTLFAPPAETGQPTANREGSAPSPPVAARPATSTPGHGWRPAASTPSERDTTQQPTTTKPGKKTTTDHRSADRDLPDYVPPAVLAQPEEGGPELLLVPPRQGPQAGVRPSIHIKWDERLDDDVPAVPLSGIARGRELAKARRAVADAPAAGAGSPSPAANSTSSAAVVQSSGSTPRHRDLPLRPLAVPPGRDFAAAPGRTTTSRRVKVTTAAVLLSALVIGGLWWRDVPWNSLPPPWTPATPDGPSAVTSTTATGTTTGAAASGVTPPSSEPAPDVADRQVTEDRAAAAPPSSRDVLRAATDAPGPSPSIPVPPPVRVEVPAAASVGSPAVANRDAAPARPPVNLAGEIQPEVPRDLPAETPARPPLPPAAETESTRSPVPAATPAAVAPAPAPPTTAAPAPGNEVSTASSAEADVRDALASYRSAYASLDAAAARRIWPTVDERALARAFSSLKSQQIRFDRCDVQVENGAAMARCEGAATFVPRVGRQEPQTEQRRWSFVLRPSSDGWRIERAETSR